MLPCRVYSRCTSFDLKWCVFNWRTVTAWYNFVNYITYKLSNSEDNIYKYLAPFITAKYSAKIMGFDKAQKSYNNTAKHKQNNQNRHLLHLQSPKTIEHSYKTNIRAIKKWTTVITIYKWHKTCSRDKKYFRLVRVQGVR